MNLLYFVEKYNIKPSFHSELALLQITQILRYHLQVDILYIMTFEIDII